MNVGDAMKDVRFVERVLDALELCQWEGGIPCREPRYMGTGYCAAHIGPARRRSIAKSEAELGITSSGSLLPPLDSLTEAEREDLVRIANEHRSRSYESDRVRARMDGYADPPSPAEFTMNDLEIWEDEQS